MTVLSLALNNTSAEKPSRSPNSPASAARPSSSSTGPEGPSAFSCSPNALRFSIPAGPLQGAGQVAHLARLKGMINKTLAAFPQRHTVSQHRSRKDPTVSRAGSDRQDFKLARFAGSAQRAGREDTPLIIPQVFGFHLVCVVSSDRLTRLCHTAYPEFSLQPRGRWVCACACG